jgi:hypothetical protein
MYRGGMLIAFSCFVLLGNAQTFLTNGLVGFYPFKGSAEDKSGLGNNGIAHGATLTTDRFGQPDAAYSFDGISDYIEIPESSAFDSEDFSISMWFMPLRNPDNAITSKQADFLFSKERFNFELHTGSGVSGNTAMRFLPRSGTEFWDSPADSYQTNVWQQVTAIFQPSAQKVRLFINGKELVLIGPSTFAAGADNASAARIGMRSNDTFPFEGTIDDIRIYNRALNDEEVSKLYAFESSPSLPLEIEVANVRVKWPSEAGAVYEIQYSTAFQDWTQLTTVQGTGETVEYVDATQGQKRFYRVVKK